MASGSPRCEPSRSPRVTCRSGSAATRTPQSRGRFVLATDGTAPFSIPREPRRSRQDCVQRDRKRGSRSRCGHDGIHWRMTPTRSCQSSAPTARRPSTTSWPSQDSAASPSICVRSNPSPSCSSPVAPRSEPQAWARRARARTRRGQRLRCAPVARSPTFDLAAQLANRSFTPGQRDAPGLVEVIVAGGEPAATRAAPALAGLRAGGRVAIGARFESADEAAKARLGAVLGLLARGGDAEAAKIVIGRMQDTATRVRRAAAIALGKLGGDAAGAVLITRWDAVDVTPDERRALAEALGKIVGTPALPPLRAPAPRGDRELARLRGRPPLMADRSPKPDPGAA